MREVAEINLTEYLTRVLADIEEGPCDIVADDDLQVDEPLLLDIVSKLHEHRERDCFLTNLLDYLPPQSLSQNVFDYLLKNKIGLISLAHMNLDDKKLKKLVPYAQEALLTLAKRYYGRSEYSVADFAGFLREYDDGELLGHLGLVRPAPPQKEQVLFYFYAKDEKHRSEIGKRIEARCLEVTDDVSRIQRAYESNEPLWHLALSKNIFAPVDLLEALTGISGIENASYIRENSRATLALKKNLDSTAKRSHKTGGCHDPK